MLQTIQWRIALSILALCAATSLMAAPVASPLLPDTRLPEAVKSGDQAAVEALLKAHVSVDSAEGDGSTALHWAAYDNDLALARILLAAHANVNATTRLEAMTPLYMACQNGSAPMIELLLTHGANANGANALGTTPLMIAAASGSVDAVKVLLDHGADVNAREGVRDQTALMFAANQDRADVIRLLVAHGADPNLQSKVVTPYHFPTRMAVLDPNNASKKPADGSTEKAADATEAGSASAGADTKPASSSGAVLQSANQAPVTPVDSNALQAVPGDAAKKTDAAKKAPVREYGAKLMGGMSPLLYAARQGNIAAATALLDSGAKIDEVSGSEHTSPLIIAIANAHLDLAKILVDRGADVNLANDQGLTPLYATIDVKWVPHEWSPEPLVDQEKTDYLQLMQLLIQHGANVNAKLGKNVWERTLSQNQTWIDRAGSTAFFRAAEANDVKAMHLLKDAGADPSIATTGGVTPLMAAAGLGWGANYSRTMPTRLDAVKYALSLGNEINKEDDLGYSALDGAAFVGNLDVIRYLVSQGADINSKTKAGDTVADVANGLFEKSLPQGDAVALLVSMGLPQPHNCRSSECLPEINAKVRGNVAH